ncbi:deleted in malignant brain tumors 1 protein-like [Gymnodraco acuticeps]|uniref:Deleted in malignant brain tumors 1 protein-like n=1 Tax=Gymnodraco acuticeps TaxID=8218 RepID=A0A6P8VFW4_GYMAC|nr:deleted in malignant brain tumors 1 protein-like [Gymnodraco acuticeps]
MCCFDLSLLYLLSSPDSVRLVNGTSLCSGRLECVRLTLTSRMLRWSAGSWAVGLLQSSRGRSMEKGRLQWGPQSSSVEAMSLLCLDCSSASERNTCSPGTAVSLTCSEPVRLVGGQSRCAGDLELKHQGKWRPVSYNSPWTLEAANVFCRDLDCGSAVSVGERKESSKRRVWLIRSTCVQSGSALRECAASGPSNYILSLSCSDLLFQPNISVSSSMYGVSGAQQQGIQVFRGSTFTISCSIQPQYPGGSFQLNFPSINSANTYYSLPAVNHSAHFLFPSAEPAHQGNYSCVYHLFVFSHNFSSESRLLSVTVTVTDPEPFIIRAVVLPLILLLVLLVTVSLYFYCKATRGRRPSRQEDIELDYDDIELDYDDLDAPAEEEGAPGAE